MRNRCGWLRPSTPPGQSRRTPRLQLQAAVSTSNCCKLSRCGKPPLASTTQGKPPLREGLRRAGLASIKVAYLSSGHESPPLSQPVSSSRRRFHSRNCRNPTGLRREPPLPPWFTSTRLLMSHLHCFGSTTVKPAEPLRRAASTASGHDPAVESPSLACHRLDPPWSSATANCRHALSRRAVFRPRAPPPPVLLRVGLGVQPVPLSRRVASPSP